MRALRLIGQGVAGFFRDNGFMLAGSLSYFTMMALIPFSVFIITLFGQILGQHPDFLKFFSSKVSSFFPVVAQDVTQDIVRMISHKGIGQFSLLLYGFLSYQVFASVENALNIVFKVRKKRHMIVSVFLSFVVVSVIIGLLAVSFAASSAMQLLKVYGPEIPGVKIGKITQFVIRFVLPFGLVFSCTALMYVIAPRTKVSMTAAFRGAFFTTVFLELAKHLFTLYVSTLGQFGRIYGPLSAVILFLLWIFYSSSIFLIGAEIVHAIHERE